ncbi:MAG: hypothetical protein KDE46_30030 [Caldilineaceae bacterium]|nr:hypothetical protein [Caldilineaceae bacterium]
MALPFSQSMRSLQADRGMGTFIGLSIALLVFLLWTSWFLWAPISRYETGSLVAITGDGWIVAEFPARAWESIQQGQVAYIHITPQNASGNSQNGGGSTDNTAIIIPAIVANILGRPVNDRFQVTLAIQEYTPALERKFSGKVDVEVERVTPAILVARASGQLVDTPALSINPQQ